MAEDSFTQQKAQYFLEKLEDKTVCPFIKVTAERCGLPHTMVASWLARGERDEALGVRSALANFLSDVRKIQGEWKAATMRKLSSTDKDTRDAATNDRWLLERLDRETFDMSRLPKSAPKGTSDKKPATDPQELKKAIEDLENPEPVLQ